MGTKFKCFVIGLLIFSFKANAQTGLNFQSVDSITYKYYNSGDWNNLVKLGNEALKNVIDYKFLRQRIGFAFFSKGDYIQAKKHFEKALSFDGYDAFTLTWLYYSYLNIGQQENAVFIAGRMSDSLRKSLSVKTFQAVESVELEYNFKYAATGLRSNPQYYHFGINSLIGSRVILYQMFAHYNQTFTVQGVNQIEYINDNQPEYYALLKYTFSPHWMLKSAYHYLKPTFAETTSSSNLGFLDLSARYGRFNLGINASILNNQQYNVRQSGFLAGVAFSGNMNMYLTGAFSMTRKQDSNHYIYNQTAGIKVSKKVWAEANITFGNLTDYHDHDAMYVYNLIDPTTFRTGITIFIYSGKHLIIWTNYSYEQKEYYENSLYHYNQFSYLGGIKWKL